MVYQIVWTENARQDFLAILVFLEKIWNIKVAENFTVDCFYKAELICRFPFLGMEAEKQTGVRKILVSNRNYLYYRVDEKSGIVTVLDIFDVRMDPEKIPY